MQVKNNVKTPVQKLSEMNLLFPFFCLSSTKFWFFIFFHPVVVAELAKTSQIQVDNTVVQVPGSKSV